MRSKDKRQPPLSYRPPAGRRGELRDRIIDSGLSANAFITAAIFGTAAPSARRAARLEEKLAAHILARLGHLNGQISAAPEDEGSAALLLQCRAELAEIRACLMQLLGRSP